MTYVAMLQATGTGFQLVQRFDGDIPGWGVWPNDQLFVGDFSGDGHADLYIFNGADWAMSYVDMSQSTGNDLQMTSRFDGDVRGWGGLARNDRLYVGDFNGDQTADLYIFNGLDWSMSYLGMFQSTGTSLVLANLFYGDVPGLTASPQTISFCLPISRETVRPTSSSTTHRTGVGIPWPHEIDGECPHRRLCWRLDRGVEPGWLRSV